MCIKRKCTNCSAREAFLEKVVVELIYKFDEKSYHERFSIAKVRFNFFLVHKHINIHYNVYIYMDTNPRHQHQSLYPVFGVKREIDGVVL